ncbi:MAG TPA: helix-turn-helix transcriptional regulator [Mycobacteriales bacterium]
MTSSRVGSPTVRRRRLARELRQLRETRGMTIGEVGHATDISPATVQRYETERGAVKVNYVRALLDLYGTSGGTREALIDIARSSRQKGWWAAYGDVIRPDFEEYVGLETEATSLRAYGTHLVHGLLQTPEYARALLTAVRPTDSPTNIDRLVDLRMQRQALLDRRPRFSLWAVVDEAVLRRPVGGSDVMCDQLRHLAKMAELPNVTLQVMPFSRGAHTGLDGAFSILEFPGRADPDVIYLDGPSGNTYVEDTVEISRFTLVFDHLRAEAMAPDRSVEFIEMVVRDLT